MNINNFQELSRHPLALRLLYPTGRSYRPNFLLSIPTRIAPVGRNLFIAEPRSVWVCKGRNLFRYCKLNFKFFSRPQNNPTEPQEKPNQKHPQPDNEQPPPPKRDAKVELFSLLPKQRLKIVMYFFVNYSKSGRKNLTSSLD